MLQFMKNLLSVLLLVLLVCSCKKDDLSSDASIVSFSVTDVSRPGMNLDRVYLDGTGRTISLLFADQIPADSLPLDVTATLTLPAGATSVPASGETITFSSMDLGLKYIVTAEDGTKAEHYVMLRDNQLQNSDFEDWYSANGMNGVPYEEPGKSAVSTLWASANSGTSIYGVYGTVPVLVGDNTVAQITTGETLMVPVTSGTIFTGKFDLNGAIDHPTDPSQSMLYGVPYSLQPSGIKFKYSYVPGSRYVKATLNDPGNIFGGFTVEDIEGEDMMTFYAYLEVRDGDNVREIARASFDSGDLQETMIEKTVPFIYTSLEKPTHIVVVFASSKNGAEFTGAVGSVLTVDDLELLYEE
jgi:hypothetical protein